MNVHRVLAACGVEEESDVVTCSGLGGGRIEDGEGILVFGIAAFGVRDGAFDFKIGGGRPIGRRRFAGEGSRDGWILRQHWRECEPDK